MVRRSPQWETAEIRQSNASSKLLDLSGAKQTAQRGRHLEIDQLRRREVLMSYASSSYVSPHAVIDKYGDQNASGAIMQAADQRASPAKSCRAMTIRWIWFVPS